ncbi:MAG: hypothetical protein M1831_002352 [Alyxoria varia]|nr:MAG: hypothetical protein M1831_002352 [Alyxoria varia]
MLCDVLIVDSASDRTVLENTSVVRASGKGVVADTPALVSKEIEEAPDAGAGMPEDAIDGVVVASEYERADDAEAGDMSGKSMEDSSVASEDERADDVEVGSTSGKSIEDSSVVSKDERADDIEVGSRSGKSMEDSSVAVNVIDDDKSILCGVISLPDVCMEELDACTEFVCDVAPDVAGAETEADKDDRAEAELAVVAEDGVGVVLDAETSFELLSGWADEEDRTKTELTIVVEDGWDVPLITDKEEEVLDTTVLDVIRIDSLPVDAFGTDLVIVVDDVKDDWDVPLTIGGEEEILDTAVLDVSRVDRLLVDVSEADVEAVNMETVKVDGIDVGAVDVGAVDVGAVDVEGSDIEAANVEAGDGEVIDVGKTDAVDRKVFCEKELDVEALSAGNVSEIPREVWEDDVPRDRLEPTLAPVSVADDVGALPGVDVTGVGADSVVESDNDEESRRVELDIIEDGADVVGSDMRVDPELEPWLGNSIEAVMRRVLAGERDSEGRLRLDVTVVRGAAVKLELWDKGDAFVEVEPMRLV